MSEVTKKTSDVFGITRDIPMNYVHRTSVDTALVDNLTRDKHIVIYGSSKQGKTCLRKQCLQESDYITVHCSNRWEIGDLHSAILKRAGYSLTLSSTKSVSGRNKVSASLSAKAFGVGAEIGGGGESEETVEETTAPLELDIDDVNDIIAALQRLSFDRYIVLEDFHYLPVSTQRDFAVALKAFHENSPYCFMVVGVWLEENRLVVYNGDLTGRVVAVNADAWPASCLREVVSQGAALLNVTFDQVFVDDLIDACEDSVYIVQEACYRACCNAGVYQTQDDNTIVGAAVDVEQLVKDVVDQQSGRYNSFLTQFADGFRETTLEMYRWLLYPILKAEPEDLERGLRLATIRKEITARHPEGEGLNPGNLTQALQYAASLQVDKDIKPIIIDYDQTNLRLSVVDRGFLVWLRNQERSELLEMVGLPTD